LNELEFYFPLRRTGARELRDALARALPASGERALPSVLDRLQFRPLDGYMKGVMDLVFRFDGRFHIVDWKSNFLGGQVTDYARASLQRPMEEHFYTLQYTLYTLALHQYLKRRIPGYSYAAHFGEVFYIFLRGVDPSAGPQYGIYKDRPREEAIDALAAALIDHADGPV
jgi:exodeoxyribonuclease V beta subunit